MGVENTIPSFQDEATFVLGLINNRNEGLNKNYNVPKDLLTDPRIRALYSRVETFNLDNPSHFEEINLGNELFDLLEWIPATNNHTHAVYMSLLDKYRRRQRLEEIEQEKQNIFDPTVTFSVSNDIHDMSDSLGELVKNQKARGKGLNWGYGKFDQATSGARPGELIGIVAITKGGKTNFGINLVNSFLNTNKGSTGFIFSLEMSADQLMKRVCQISLGMTVRELGETCRNADDEMFKRMQETPWSNVQYKYGQTSSQDIRELLNEHKPTIALVDYLHFIDHPDRSRGGDWANKVCTELKTWAKESGSIVILLGQIDKNTAQTKIDRNGNEIKKRPRMMDALGGIGFMCSVDTGICLYRNDAGDMIAYYDANREISNFELLKPDYLLDYDWDKMTLRRMLIDS